MPAKFPLKGAVILLASLALAVAGGFWPGRNNSPAQASASGASSASAMASVAAKAASVAAMAATPAGAEAPASAPAVGQAAPCDVCPKMVIIPAGSFMMGDANSKYSEERPVHKVNIASFALGQTEVTQGQWRALMGNNPSRFKDCGDNCPVEQVSWHDAQAYIKKLNALTKKNYRLPSEAEWEYAARAGSTGKWGFGDDAAQLGQYAWYGDNSGGKTHETGGKAGNAFGLYDMHGNVWEWVEDDWHQEYSGAPVDGSAWVTIISRNRVLRGGSWRNSPDILRSAYRGNYHPTFRNYVVGFRVARTLP